MSQPMQSNPSAHSCNRERVDQFLNSNDYRLEDEQLIAHLASCDECRQYMDGQAADPELWTNLGVLLKPGKFDQASAVDFSAATMGHFGPKPVAAQDVIDSLAPTDDPHRLGRLGTYEVTGVIGIGGMGVVLKAVDPSLDRVVAIKVMAPHLANNENARKRFAREAKAAAAVLHPNVIPIHSVASTASLPYLVMSYIRGGSLQKRLEKEGTLPTIELLRIGSQIAAGLEAAHDQGLVHRDIKPENILLEEGIERVTITDFGLARSVDDNTVTQQGTIAGTPMYMSPEQARGERVNQQSDLFSLGSVLYALCTGQPPFRGDSSFGVMRKIIDERPTPIRELNPVVTSWLAAIIEKLMAKEKAVRFQTAKEVHELLEACLSHLQQPDAIPLPCITNADGKQHPIPLFKTAKGKIAMFTLVSMTTLAAWMTLQFGGFLNTEDQNLSAGHQAISLDSGVMIEEYQKANAEKHHWKIKGHNVGKMKVQLLLISRGNSHLLKEYSLQGAEDRNSSIEVDFQIGKSNKLVMQRYADPELPALSVVGDRLLISERKFQVEDIAVDISNVPEKSAVMSKDKVIPPNILAPLYYGSYRNSDATYKQDIEGMIEDSRKRGTFVVVACHWEPKANSSKPLEANANEKPTEIPPSPNESLETPERTADGKSISIENARRIHEQSAVAFREAITRIERGPGANALTLKTLRGIRVVDDATIKIVRTVGPKDGIEDGVLSRDGKRWAWTPSTTSSKVYTLENESGKSIQLEPGGDVTGPTAFSPNGKLLAIGRSTLKGFAEGDGRAEMSLFDHSGKLLHTWESNFHEWNLPVFSPDSKILVLGTRDDELQLMEIATGNPLVRLERNGTKEIAFNPDGKLLAAAYEDGTIAIWEVSTGKLLRTAKSGCRELYSIDWSPTGAVLVTAGRGGRCALWDPDQLEKLKELETDPYEIQTVRFSTDGCRLVLASTYDRNNPASQSLFVWSIPETETYRPTTVHEANLDYASLIKATNESLANGNREEAQRTLERTDTILRGWEYDYLFAQLTRRGDEKEKLKRVFDGNSYQIERVAFTPDSQRLVVGSNQKLVKVWDLNREESIDIKDSISQSGTVAVSLDGTMFATEGSNGNIFLWDAATNRKKLHYIGHQLPTHAPYGQKEVVVKSICFSPDSKLVVSAAYSEVKIWSVETGETLVALSGPHEKGPHYITTATFSPNGKKVATGGFDKKIKLWDVATGKEILEIEGHTNNVLCVAFSPNGKQVASASADGTLAVWDVESGDEVLRMKGHAKPVFGVQFSPDGKRIVSGSWDETVRLWDAQTGVELILLGKLKGPVLSVAFSRDGSKIAAGCMQNLSRRIAEAMVWDSGTVIESK